MVPMDKETAVPLAEPFVDQPADRGVQGNPGLMWGVGAVAVRIGIATPTLRTWERRYGIGPSRRTDGGHRRYSEDDIIRVQLMGRLVTRGVPAQSAARVSQSLERDSLLEALAAPDSALSAASANSSDPPPAIVIENIIEAAVVLDAAALSQTFERVFTEYGVVRGWTTVAVPALRAIGDSWSEGSLGVDSEHLASERLAGELRAAIRSKRPRILAPIVLASAEDEMHSLPLLAVEAALAAEGVACYAMGGRLPAQSLADMVKRLKPTVVFLWASLARLRDGEAWPRFSGASRPPHLLLGGPGWPAIDTDAQPLVERFNDLSATVERILNLVRGAAPSPTG